MQLKFGGNKHMLYATLLKILFACDKMPFCLLPAKGNKDLCTQYDWLSSAHTVYTIFNTVRKCVNKLPIPEELELLQPPTPNSHSAFTRAQDCMCDQL